MGGKKKEEDDEEGGKNERMDEYNRREKFLSLLVDERGDLFNF